MKKSVVLTIILILTIGKVFTQTDSSSISFVSYWSIGDRYDFQISHFTQKWKESELLQDDTLKYMASFEVIDSTESSYTIHWRYENDWGNDYDIPENVMNQFAKYKQTEVIYKTSEMGDFLEILNWEEISETMQNLFKDIVEIVGADDKKKRNELVERMQPFIDLYSSKEAIEHLVLKDLQIFHYPMGSAFDITEAFTYEHELPNVMGGKSIIANTIITFENVNFESGFCVFNTEMSIDPEDTKKMITQALKQLKLDDKEFKKALKTSVFEIEDKNHFEFYYNPCIPYKIETCRTANIDINDEKAKKTNRTTIELVLMD